VKTKQQLNFHIRWMIRRDMPEVLAIENDVFEYPWVEEDFIKVLRRRNCIGMVAEHDDRVVGYMIYELNRTHLHLETLGVAKQVCGKGVGRMMIDKLTGKLREGGRTRITTDVRERNLDAQLFFKAMGFRCVNTIRERWDSTNEDAYVFQYRLKRCEGK